MRVDHPQHLVRAQRPDQFAFEVRVTDEHVVEHSAEPARFAGVDQADDPRPVMPRKGPPDGLRAADRVDRHALGREIAAPAQGERLECDQVARPLDQHDCARQLHAPIVGVERQEKPAEAGRRYALLVSASVPREPLAWPQPPSCSRILTGA